ncbi:MAG TPA: anti-sigma factor [Rhodanobacteraceae bacterium]|nr:anti-sigma factor [Rhodanobacteraceae bacterium]
MSGRDDMAAPADRSYLAAEYVLGVLDARQRREVELLIARDRAFAREVAAWQVHLAPLADEIEPVEPPMHILPRLRSSLFAQRRGGGLLESLGFWRWLAAGTGAVAAAALAGVFVLSRPKPVPTPPTAAPMLATIKLDDGRPAFIATIDLAQGTMLVLPVTATIPPDKVPELWLIPPGDVPHSLGVVDVAHPVAIAIPPALRSAVSLQAAVAISVEPPGGSPTGQPTGPVIAKGGISSI